MILKWIKIKKYLIRVNFKEVFTIIFYSLYTGNINVTNGSGGVGNRIENVPSPAYGELQYTCNL